MDRGALAGYSSWGPKESKTTEQLTLLLYISLSGCQNLPQWGQVSLKCWQLRRDDEHTDSSTCENMPSYGAWLGLT